MEEERAPSYLIIGRISAVIGMSFAAAFAILFLFGGWYLEALIALVLVAPFVGLMRFLEVWATRNSR